SYDKDIAWVAHAQLCTHSLEPIALLRRRVARQPAGVCFVDPKLFGEDADDDHPMRDVRRGQAFVARVASALAAPPQWSRALCLIVVALGASACVPDDEPGPGPESPPVVVREATLAPNRALARAADSHLVNYGAWDAAKIATAQAHDVVVVYPNRAGVDRTLIS